MRCGRGSLKAGEHSHKRASLDLLSYELYGKTNRDKIAGFNIIGNRDFPR